MVTTTTHGYTFSRARSPSDSPLSETTLEMESIPPVGIPRPAILVESSPGAPGGSRRGEEDVSPTTARAAIGLAR